MGVITFHAGIKAWRYIWFAIIWFILNINVIDDKPA